MFDSSLSRADELREQAVQVWILDSRKLRGCSDLLIGYLDEQEQREAYDYTSTRERERFELYRGAFRMVLGRYAACSPREIELVRNRNGKPRRRPRLDEGGVLTEEPLHFNLSHSHDYALVAVSRAGEVGVDIERVRLPKGAATLMEHFFLPDETAAVMTAPPEEQGDLFCRLWTRKEAAVKCFGGSLAEWIQLLDVGGTGPHLTVRYSGLPELHLRHIPVASGYQACLCTTWRPDSVSVVQLECEAVSEPAG